MPSLLHNHPEFIELLRIVADDLKISPVLVEKDYWIMHSLWGLQQMGLTFQLKGGTSLSKGFGIIDRFSEDIDILIEPPPEMNVKTGKNQDKKRAHCESRRKYYDYLADTITIDGIVSVQRDHEFDGDDGKYRQGGIRLRYHNLFADSYLKEGILLEVEFDDVTPNTPCDISSWAYDYAVGKIKLADNRAKAVQCYHPGYTLVEKLQTIARKFNQWQEKRQKPVNFIRHYYDVHCLLKSEAVLGFIGSAEYEAHKEKRFSQKDNPVISTNNAFLLHDPKTRAMLSSAYEASDTLYCKGHPSFDEILETIRAAIENGL